ncbi:unnamed protein product [Schistosoma guineensis]|nr:unnamed protein product [Schistosoma guineensis]
MGFMSFLSILVVLLLLYDEILAKSKSKGFGSSKTLSISKPKHRYSGRSSFYSRRSGLSNSRKKALFFTAGALAGIYIGSRMRSHVYLRSYRDLYNYEVCEGQRTEFINSTGMTRTYSYFLCPDNPNQPFEKYCCWDSATGMGACCSYDVKMYSHSGSIYTRTLSKLWFNVCNYVAIITEDTDFNMSVPVRDTYIFVCLTEFQKQIVVGCFLLIFMILF